MKKQPLKQENEKFIDKWRSYNRTRDLFYQKKLDISVARFKADIMEKFVRWLEIDSFKNMETQFELKIDYIKTGDILQENALQNAWIAVIEELKLDGFNLDYSVAESDGYKLIIKIVSDAQEKKNKAAVKKIMKDLKKKINTK
jgi:hypothetical protein